MANTSSRTLRLLSLLQSRRYWPGPDLADRLGVSSRTLRRDIDRLRELGYPVDANPGVDGGYALAAGAAMPPLVVDDDEAMALAVAVQSQLAGRSSGPDGDEAGLRALTKIIQVMPRRLRARLDAVRSATTPVSWAETDDLRLDPTVLSTLALACRDRERVRFDYQGLSAPRTSRRVEPLRLISLGRRWYLVGYDLTRGDWRTFRIDRIGAAESTGTPFAPRTPPFEDVADFIRSRVGGSAAGGRHHVEVEVHAPPARVVERFGDWARVEPVTAERCRLTMDTDRLEGPLFALGGLGADFTVIGPPELAALALEWAARFSRAGAG